jgi:hypothetical protein
VRDILENPQAGFGEALNLVIDMSEEERTRVSKAFARTFLSGRAKPTTCPIPGCDRPVEDSSFPGCKEHRRAYDAQALTDAWDFVLTILGPWVETARPIGSDELTRTMEGALAEAEREYNRAQDELEAAEAAL